MYASASGLTVADDLAVSVPFEFIGPGAQLLQRDVNGSGKRPRPIFLCSPYIEENRRRVPIPPHLVYLRGSILGNPAPLKKGTGYQTDYYECNNGDNDHRIILCERGGGFEVCRHIF